VQVEVQHSQRVAAKHAHAAATIMLHPQIKYAAFSATAAMS
jgi:hypothetical protein